MLVPTELVLEWRQSLAKLPPDGEVARHLPEVRDALLKLMDLVVGDDALALTVQTLM